MADIEAIGVRAILGSGVYVLRARGHVVHVGQGRSILAKVYGHAVKPNGGNFPWSPAKPIEFDDIEVYKCRVDQLNDLYFEVCVKVGWTLPGATVSTLRAATEVVTKMRRRA